MLLRSARVVYKQQHELVVSRFWFFSFHIHAIHLPAVVPSSYVNECVGLIQAQIILAAWNKVFACAAGVFIGKTNFLQLCNHKKANSKCVWVVLSSSKDTWEFRISGVMIIQLVIQGSGFSDPIHVYYVTFYTCAVWLSDTCFTIYILSRQVLKTDCSDQREEPTISTKHSTKMFIYELFWGTDCFSFVLHVLFCPFDSVEVWKPRAHGPRYRH